MVNIILNFCVFCFISLPDIIPGRGEKIFHLVNSKGMFCSFRALHCRPCISKIVFLSRCSIILHRRYKKSTKYLFLIGLNTDINDVIWWSFFSRKSTIYQKHDSKSGFNRKKSDADGKGGNFKRCCFKKKIQKSLIARKARKKEMLLHLFFYLHDETPRSPKRFGKRECKKELIMEK